ncbi:methionine ABC transporter permease [Tepidibacillus marianensis]|uniref:methionine ABC transporter permease n=1 Tax=Tepidibacillus marianensis TaxID=3131995 RepID=UPI0030D35333
MSINRWLEIYPELIKAFNETIFMVGISLSISILVGIPTGILLFVSDKGLFLENRWLNLILSTIANIIRSIPFIILLVFLLPFTQFLIGETIGPTAAAVPLSVAAIPFYARLVETSLREIDKGVIEAAIATGASPFLIIKEVLLPEARSGLVHGLTITAISLIGYSAMAGIVGGGGVGDLAIRFGYYRYENDIMFLTVTILIVLVQILQFIGDRIAKLQDRR